MRYTRYNYKKNKNNGMWKTILSFVAMSVFVVIVGVLLANVIIYFLPINDASKVQANGNTIEQTDTDNTNKDSEGEEGSDIVDGAGDTQVSGEVASEGQSDTSGQAAINTSFIAIQCGYFSQEDNAKVEFNKISSNYGAFIYNDSDKYKVLAGVYTAAEGEAVMNKLAAQGTTGYKVSFDLNASNTIQSQVSGIINGYLDILNEAFKDDVKSFDTKDFKAWLNKLDSITEGDKQEVLVELKNHMNEIPTEIKKEDVAAEMKYLYEILLKFN